MDNLNNIPISGNWGDAASKLNDNFNKVKQAITTVENASQNNKGYFTSLSALNTAFPSPKTGQTAYVYDNATSNYIIYNAVNGLWATQSVPAPPIGVAVNDYAKHGGSSKTLKQVDDEIVQLAGEVSNKLDKTLLINVEWITGSFIYKTDGSIGNNASYSASQFIEIINDTGDYILNMKIAGNVVAAIAFYDSTQNYINSIPEGEFNDYNIKFPDNAAFFRLSIQNINKPSFSLFIKYNYAKQSDLDKKLENPLSEYTVNWLDGHYISNIDGTVGTTTVGFSASQFIEVSSHLACRITLRVSGNVAAAIAFYDFNQNLISLINSVPEINWVEQQIYFPEDTTYIRITAQNTYIADFSLELGESYVFESQLNNVENRVAVLEEGRGQIANLQEYINLNRVVNLGAQTFNITSPLIIPNNTRISGVRGGTVFKLSSGASIVNLGANSQDISLENITFEGRAAVSGSITLESIKNRSGIGQDTGIFCQGYAKNIHVRNCEFRNFSMAGIRLLHTHSGQYTRTFKISDSIFINNYCGLLSDVRSEYHTVMGCSFNYNRIGCYIEGGNNFMATCHFDANGAGCVVSGLSANNDSHGSITGSSFNHNTSYSIVSISINNGFTFSGCHVFDGDIMLDNSKGFSYNGGIIAAGIQIQNANASINMFLNNVFLKSYNGGTIVGDTDKLSLSGNRFIDGSDSAIINNSV